MIIIEGPDRSGKTTLCQQFQKWGYAYAHEGVPADKQELLQHYALQVTRAQRKTVFDRLNLGEHVYGPIMRGVDLLEGYQGLKLMNRLFTGQGCLVVICLPEYETCLKHWRRNKEHEYVQSEEQFAQIYDRYQELAFELTETRATKFNYTIFDYEKDDPLHLLHLHSELKPSYRNVIGNQSPMFLFVGEVANHAELDLPFFSVGGSSRFLNDALEDAGYSEHEIAFVNALTLDHQILKKLELREMLMKPRIIALGNVAAAVLKGAHMHANITIGHPAYWKRFRSGERDEYVQELKDFRERTYRGYGYNLALDQPGLNPEAQWFKRLRTRARNKGAAGSNPDS